MCFVNFRGHRCGQAELPVRPQEGEGLPDDIKGKPFKEQVVEEGYRERKNDASQEVEKLFVRKFSAVNQVRYPDRKSEAEERT